ncbi:hypothetical protein E2986_10080 [Frieseomelitta varia]|uniref:MEIOB-like N-terminal domain-containing protein n=1 Tax=Frieseomelitta varia TaxID=561572 RepID=A0A833W6T6_9HYME|nr:hypothetical protein E2986_10080 [Frieseomelitta varia]
MLDLTMSLNLNLNLNTVEVINPKVLERRPDDKSEIFVPSVTSTCSLTVNEGNALVQIHDAPTRAKYEPLLMLPIKKLTGLRTLKSISENLEALRDQYVDVLVVVTFVRFRFRNRRQVSVKLADFVVRKTMITENPDIPQCAAIRNTVQCYDNDIVSENFATPNPDTITSVMTIKEISEKLNKKPKQGERIQFATILKAYVMDMNVESLSPAILSTRCALCKKVIADNQDSCMNLECPSGNGTRVPLNVMSLNLKVNLKDSTGYLIGCRLFGDVAERVLGCTANEFQAMILPQRTELKWKLALEKCDIRLHVLGPTATIPNAIYNILSICRIQEDEDTEDTEDTELINNFVSNDY